MITCIQYEENVNYCFHYQNDDWAFDMNTEDIKALLDDVPINQPEIILWLKDYIKEGMHQ